MPFFHRLSLCSLSIVQIPPLALGCCVLNGRCSSVRSCGFMSVVLVVCIYQQTYNYFRKPQNKLQLFFILLLYIGIINFL